MCAAFGVPAAVHMHDADSYSPVINCDGGGQTGGGANQPAYPPFQMDIRQRHAAHVCERMRAQNGVAGECVDVAVAAAKPKLTEVCKTHVKRRGEFGGDFASRRALQAPIHLGQQDNVRTRKGRAPQASQDAVKVTPAVRIESDDLERRVGSMRGPVYDYGIECGRRQGRLEGGGGALLHNEKGLALKLGLDLL